jgi:hypothetical protein
MTEPYQDHFNVSFYSLADMIGYHAEQAKHSLWNRTEVDSLNVEPLDENSPLYSKNFKWLKIVRLATQSVSIYFIIFVQYHTFRAALVVRISGMR